MKNRPLRYQNVLISPEFLKTHRDEIYRFLTELNLSALSPKDKTALYLLFFIKLRTPHNWFQKKSSELFKMPNSDSSLLVLGEGLINFSKTEKEKLKDLSVFEFFKNYRFKGIPECVNRVMENWYLNNWELKMIHYIPSSKSLLKLQAENKRFLTLIIDPEQCQDLILGKRDPLSFAIHDLMHADQFFNNPISKASQLGFYKLIANVYDNKNILNLLSNEQFKDEFDYVVSDMNAYIIHLLKCFKGVFERHNYSQNFFDYFKELSLPEGIIDSINKIGTHHFNHNDEIIIKNYFEEIS